MNTSLERGRVAEGSRDEPNTVGERRPRAYTRERVDDGGHLADDVAGVRHVGAGNDDAGGRQPGREVVEGVHRDRRDLDGSLGDDVHVHAAPASRGCRRPPVRALRALRGTGTRPGRTRGRERTSRGRLLVSLRASTAPATGRRGGVPAPARSPRPRPPCASAASRARRTRRCTRAHRRAELVDVGEEFSRRIVGADGLRGFQRVGYDGGADVPRRRRHRVLPRAHQLPSATPPARS